MVSSKKKRTVPPPTKKRRKRGGATIRASHRLAVASATVKAFMLQKRPFYCIMDLEWKPFWKGVELHGHMLDAQLMDKNICSNTQMKNPLTKDTITTCDMGKIIQRMRRNGQKAKCMDHCNTINDMLEDLCVSFGIHNAGRHFTVWSTNEELAFNLSDTITNALQKMRSHTVGSSPLQQQIAKADVVGLCNAWISLRKCGIIRSSAGLVLHLLQRMLQSIRVFNLSAPSSLMFETFVLHMFERMEPGFMKEAARMSFSEYTTA